MRALTLTSFGGLDGVVLTDVAEPEMPDDAVTVRVHAVALAKWDVTTTEGVFVAMGGMTTFPQVLGWDFAGVISSAGSSVAGWEPGDRVLGFSPQPWTGTGVIAELVVLPPSMIAALPAELDFIAGATLPVTCLTAQQIVDAGGLRDGTAALVIGATGAVGGVVVQLGRDRGARMIASVGSVDFGRVRDLGAADAASLTSLAERYANRSLTMTTTVAGVFPLPRARQALEAVSRGKGREKYVLDLQQ